KRPTARRRRQSSFERNSKSSQRRPSTYALLRDSPLKTRAYCTRSNVFTHSPRAPSKRWPPSDLHAWNAAESSLISACFAKYITARQDQEQRKNGTPRRRGSPCKIALLQRRLLSSLRLNHRNN